MSGSSFLSGSSLATCAEYVHHGGPSAPTRVVFTNIRLQSIGSQFISEPLDEFALTRRQQNITASKSRVNRRNNGDESGSNGEKFGVEGNPSTETPSRWSSFMERYDRDRRSVFCGNLPSDTTEIELRRVLERTGGHVKGVKIIRGAHSAYAFIEFGRADVYEAAIGILVSYPPLPLPSSPLSFRQRERG